MTPKKTNPIYQPTKAVSLLGSANYALLATVCKEI